MPEPAGSQLEQAVLARFGPVSSIVWDCSDSQVAHGKTWARSDEEAHRIAQELRLKLVSGNVTRGDAGRPVVQGRLDRLDPYAGIAVIEVLVGEPPDDEEP